MKEVLVAKPLENINLIDFFDDKKSIYKPVPTFPFLTEEDVLSALHELCDFEEIKKEIKEVQRKGHNKIPNTEYVICLTDWFSYPNLIAALTIIREWAFRNEGGGVGKNDMDAFDTLPITQQLMILNPHAESLLDVIIGGYRYQIHSGDTYEEGPMGDHFTFNPNIKKETWSELGRSFINPFYQKRETRQSFDYVLHGLGFIYANNQHIKGYFGKVTLYNIYEQREAHRFFTGTARQYWKASDLMNVYDNERVEEGELTDDQKSMLDRDIFKGMFYILRKEYQINLVPIMAVYNRMTALENMFYFGAFRHHAFGNTIEVGMGIAIENIRPIIMEKFVDPYR